MTQDIRLVEAQRLRNVWQSAVPESQPMKPWKRLTAQVQGRWLALADDSLGTYDNSPRNIIRRAAHEWATPERAMLAYLIGLGRPSEVLDACRTLTARGVGADSSGPRALPPTTKAQWVLSGALSLWRDIGIILGLDVLPKPGSVHASIASKP